MKFEIDGTEEEIEGFIKRYAGVLEQKGVKVVKPFVPAKRVGRGSVPGVKRGPYNVKRKVVVVAPKKRGRRVCRPWTKEEDELLREWYPKKNGARRLAKKLKRTQMAVFKHANNAGIKKIDVSKRRLVTRGEVKHEPPMLKKHATVPASIDAVRHKLAQQTSIQSVVPFPRFSVPTVSVDIVKGVFKNLVASGDKQRLLTYANDSYVFGIESVAMWNRFASETLMLSAQVCAHFGVANKLVLQRNGNELSIRYG